MRLYNIVTGARLFVLSRPKFILLSVVCALVIGPSANAGCSPSAVTVTISVDGQSWEYVSSQPTAGAVLKEAGVILGENDLVQPKLSARPHQGMHIRITRVTDKVVVQTEPISFKTKIKFNPYGSGGRKVLREGRPGEKEIKYLVTYKDGVKVGSKILSARVVRQPVHEIAAVSRGTTLASRAGSYKRTVRMLATAYEPYNCGGSGTGRTASGMQAGKGVVAVDPRFIPLGTKLYVEGYGYCIAGDTGGAIKGTRIDLGFNTYREAIRFGRRWVTVHVLD